MIACVAVHLNCQFTTRSGTLEFTIWTVIHILQNTVFQEFGTFNTLNASGSLLDASGSLLDALGSLLDAFNTPEELFIHNHVAYYLALAESLLFTKRDSIFE